VTAIVSSSVRRYWSMTGSALFLAPVMALRFLPAVMRVPVVLRWQLTAAVTAAAAAWALFKFVVSIQRDRVVADTPLARIRSAAQGYVRVFGRARAPADEPTAAPLSSRPCVWWSYCVEENERDSDGEEWCVIESGSSVEPFVIADTDGECLVGPVNAEVTPTVDDVWYGHSVRPNGPPQSPGFFSIKGKYRYTERLLQVGDRLTVTGELRSKSELDSSDQAAVLLRQWKQNQPALLARFDRDRDGRLNAAEWDAARQAAADEARTRMLQTCVVRISVIGQPTHGEPFLIASMDGAQLVRREKRHAVLFLMFGLACVAGCALALGEALAH